MIRRPSSQTPKLIYFLFIKNLLKSMIANCLNLGVKSLENKILVLTLYKITNLY